MHRDDHAPAPLRIETDDPTRLEPRTSVLAKPPLKVDGEAVQRGAHLQVGVCLRMQLALCFCLLGQCRQLRRNRPQTRLGASVSLRELVSPQVASEQGARVGALSAKQLEQRGKAKGEARAQRRVASREHLLTIIGTEPLREQDYRVALPRVECKERPT